MEKNFNNSIEDESVFAIALAAIEEKYGKFNEYNINFMFDDFSQEDIDLINMLFNSESKDELVSKSLTQWFKEKWVDISRPKPGGGFEPCGRSDARTGKYPKCVPAARAARMSPEQIASAVRRKRTAESTQQRDGKKPINVSTEKAASINVPTDPALYARVKAAAKAKFNVYPSAYANAWLVREYKKRGGGYKTIAKDYNLDENIVNMQYQDQSCPISTQDIAVNLRNRQICVNIANYGPMNPELDNVQFWNQKSKLFNSTVEEAKTSRCSNCAAFIQTKDIIDCIAEGFGGEKIVYEIIDTANLGYCELFDFKCAGVRTCDAWLVGGPVKDSQTIKVDNKEELINILDTMIKDVK